MKVQTEKGETAISSLCGFGRVGLNKFIKVPNRCLDPWRTFRKKSLQRMEGEHL